MTVPAVPDGLNVTSTVAEAPGSISTMSAATLACAPAPFVSCCRSPVCTLIARSNARLVAVTVSVALAGLAAVGYGPHSVGPGCHSPGVPSPAAAVEAAATDGPHSELADRAADATSGSPA